MGNQSGYIVVFILLAFFVYITLKGELPIYAGLLLLSPQAPSGTAQQQAAAGNTTITSNAIVSAGFAAFGL